MAPAVVLAIVTIWFSLLAPVLGNHSPTQGAMATPPAVGYDGYHHGPCGLLAATYGNLSGSSYSSNFTTIFGEICTTSQFSSLYQEGLNSSGQFGAGTFWNGSGPPSLAFMLSRVAACTDPSMGQECDLEAWWYGHLSNNSFSGPEQSQYPALTSESI